MTQAKLVSPVQNNANPCLACSLEQNCCEKLDGLKLTRTEFEHHFAQHADKFDIDDHGEWLELTTTGEVCPHWQGQCQVYESRPIECRLYPHSISEVVSNGDSVTLAFHIRTACPLKQELRETEETATEMVRNFGADAFGVDCKIAVHSEEGMGLLFALPLKINRKLRGG